MTKIFLQQSLLAGLYLALGLYCLSSGGVIFYLLNRESDDLDQP